MIYNSNPMISCCGCLLFFSSNLWGPKNLRSTWDGKHQSKHMNLRDMSTLLSQGYSGKHGTTAHFQNKDERLPGNRMLVPGAMRRKAPPPHPPPSSKSCPRLFHVVSSVVSSGTEGWEKTRVASYKKTFTEAGKGRFAGEEKQGKTFCTKKREGHLFVYAFVLHTWSVTRI